MYYIVVLYCVYVMRINCVPFLSINLEHICFNLRLLCYATPVNFSENSSPVDW